MKSEASQGRLRSKPTLVEKAESALKAIEYRRISTHREFEDVKKLRFDAYSRKNNVFSDQAYMRTDSFDEEPNTEIYGLYSEGKIISSLRLHRVSAETPATPSATYFPEFFMTRLAAGDQFLEPTRFVASQEGSVLFPNLHFLTMRVCFMATVHYQTRYILCSVRAKHGAYYRKFFKMDPVITGKTVPTIAVPADLYVGDAARDLHLVEARLPFMRSTLAERSALFGAANQVEAKRSVKCG